MVWEPWISQNNCAAQRMCRCCPIVISKFGHLLRETWRKLAQHPWVEMVPVLFVNSGKKCYTSKTLPFPPTVLRFKPHSTWRGEAPGPPDMLEKPLNLSGRVRECSWIYQTLRTNLILRVELELRYFCYISLRSPLTRPDKNAMKIWNVTSSESNPVCVDAHRFKG